MKKILLIYIVSFAVLTGVNSQQIPHLSQYTINQYYINPAATGISENIPVAFTFRKLWAGIDGSPSIQFLSAHSLVAENMGAGMKVFGYQAGPLKKTGLEATYSYHLNPGGGETKLSFGLSGMIYQYFLNKSDLKIEDPNDVVFMGEEKMIVPDASFGMYLYNPKYYAGISIPQLFNRSIDLKTDNVLQLKQVRHYYLHGGYIFNVNDDIKLEPSLLLKMVEAGLFQTDINTRFTYKEMLLFGLSYRTSDAVVFQLGYQNNSFLIGYSFDMTVNGLNTQTFGSHELMLIYSFANFIRK